MKKIIFISVVILLFMVGCTGEKISEAHQQFLQTYDWHIKDMESEENQTLNFSPEWQESLKAAGVNLGPYEGEEAKVTFYTLQEKQTNGDQLTAVILEADGKIIGGYGILENWSPGLFSLNSKKQLVEDKVVKE